MFLRELVDVGISNLNQCGLTQLHCNAHETSLFFLEIKSRSVLFMCSHVDILLTYHMVVPNYVVMG